MYLYNSCYDTYDYPQISMSACLMYLHVLVMQFVKIQWAVSCVHAIQPTQAMDHIVLVGFMFHCKLMVI